MAQLPFFSLPGMSADVDRIERALTESVRTSDAYLDEIASHLIVAGGKRLRPVLTVVAARSMSPRRMTRARPSAATRVQ